MWNENCVEFRTTHVGSCVMHQEAEFRNTIIQWRQQLTMGVDSSYLSMLKISVHLHLRNTAEVIVFMHSVTDRTTLQSATRLDLSIFLISYIAVSESAMADCPPCYVIKNGILLATCSVLDDWDEADGGRLSAEQTYFTSLQEANRKQDIGSLHAHAKLRRELERSELIQNGELDRDHEGR